MRDDDIIELDLGEEDPVIYEKPLKQESVSAPEEISIETEKEPEQETPAEVEQPADEEDMPEESSETVTEPPAEEVQIPADTAVTAEEEAFLWEGLDPETDIYEVDPVTGEPIEEGIGQDRSKMQQEIPEEEESEEELFPEEVVEEEDGWGEEPEEDNRPYIPRTDLFTAIPENHIDVEWYLSLPFLTALLFVPVVGWIAVGYLLYLRRTKYRGSMQIRNENNAFIFVVLIILILICVVYLIVALFSDDSGNPVNQSRPAVTEHDDRDAAESQARAEAESREQAELEEQQRTLAHADIGVERPESSGSPSQGEEPEGSAAETETSDESQPAETGESVPETKKEDDFFGSLWDRLTGGKGEEEEEISIEQAEADRQEFAALGDYTARYSLQRLASPVTVMTALYDERFYGERQVLFSFMSGYHGVEISNLSINVKPKTVVLVGSNQNWEATVNPTRYRYVGSLENGQPNGLGVVLIASSVNPNTYIPYYAGTFVNGILNGYGMIFQEYDGGLGITYEGFFEGGRYCGKGSTYLPANVSNYTQRLSMTDSAGAWYTPEEVNSILNSCVARFGSAMSAYQAEGQIYAYMDAPLAVPIITESGRYKDGRTFGYCIQYGPFGRRNYAGILRSGSRTGQGVSYYENGAVEYDGEWKGSKFNGYGILYTEDGVVRYEGEFQGGDIKTGA